MAVSYSSNRKLTCHVLAENKEILSFLFIFVKSKLKTIFLNFIEIIVNIFQ